MMVTLPLFDKTLKPRSLIVDPPMTDAELEMLCLRSDVVRIERTREGVITMNPPAGALTGDGNSEIIYQLRSWWKRHQRGRVFDCNTGFFLADGSMLSPDAAYVLQEQLAGMTRVDLERMPRLCPVFVVELLSPSDSLRETQKKMESWVTNGARLAWLVDPYRKCVEVYAPGAEATVVDGEMVEGTDPVVGFQLELSHVWSCYEV